MPGDTLVGHFYRTDSPLAINLMSKIHSACDGVFEVEVRALNHTYENNIICVCLRRTMRRGGEKENTMVRLLERCPQRAIIFILFARARTHADSGFNKTNIRHLKVNSLVVSFIQCFSLYRPFVQVQRTPNTTKIKTQAYEPEQREKTKTCSFLYANKAKKTNDECSGVLFLLLARRPDIIIILIVRKALSIVPPLFHYHFT